MARRTPRQHAGAHGGGTSLKDRQTEDALTGDTTEFSAKRKKAIARSKEIAQLRTTGRPTALTPRTEDVIIGAILGGNHMQAAARLAGVHPRTLLRWLERGESAQQKIDDGDGVAETELPFVAFSHRLHDARAQAESKAVGVIQSAMHGGTIISEQIVVDANGTVVIDPETGRPFVNRTYSTPDGRLALNYLARSRPDQWGNNGSQEIRVTGSDGGPVKVVHEIEHIHTLAGRLADIVGKIRADDESDLPDGGMPVLEGEAWEEGQGQPAPAQSDDGGDPR